MMHDILLPLPLLFVVVVVVVSVVIGSSDCCLLVVLLFAARRLFSLPMVSSFGSANLFASLPKYRLIVSESKSAIDCASFGSILCGNNGDGATCVSLIGSLAECCGLPVAGVVHGLKRTSSTM